MPNWCKNRLVVTGDPDAIVEFQRECGASESPTFALDFERVDPTPPETYDHPYSETAEAKELLQRLRDAGDGADKLLEEHPGLRLLLIGTGGGVASDQIPGWYGWRLDHWGTKWNAEPSDQCLLEADPQRLVLELLTAWAPPLPLLATLAARYPQLRFELTYSEPGVGFAGFEAWKGGERLQSECVSHDLAPFLSSHGSSADEAALLS